MSKQRIIKLEVLSLVRFDNGLHAQFHRKQQSLVAAAEVEKLHLPAGLMDEWKNSIDLEVEINKVALMSADTARLVELDKERDELIVHLFAMTRAHRSSPVKDLHEKAEDLWAAIKPYSNIAAEAYETESGHIVGLLHDLEKLSAETTALGLTHVLTQLQTVNEKYEALRTSKSTTAAASKLPTAKEVRPKTDEVYEVVCGYIQSSWFLAANDADRKIVAELIKQLNKISDEFKTSHNESKAQRKSAGKRSQEKQLEEDRALLARLLPPFEKQEGFAEGSLVFTGVAKGKGKKRTYEIEIKSSGEKRWVKVDDNWLFWTEA